jgi:cysteine desulfuration protein SufE
MTDLPASGSPGHLPPSIERVLARFRALGREEKMQVLLAQARRLEPAPAHLTALHDASYEVPECQTPVRIFLERNGPLLHFYADIDARRSPTVAAFLSIVFLAVNEQPPEVTLAIPGDFVRQTMSSIGLGTREVGLDALVARLKRLARETATRGA